MYPCVSPRDITAEAAAILQEISLSGAEVLHELPPSEPNDQPCLQVCPDCQSLFEFEFEG